MQIALLSPESLTPVLVCGAVLHISPRIFDTFCCFRTSLLCLGWKVTATQGGKGSVRARMFCCDSPHPGAYPTAQCFQRF